MRKVQLLTEDLKELMASFFQISADVKGYGSDKNTTDQRVQRLEE